MLIVLLLRFATLAVAKTDVLTHAQPLLLVLLMQRAESIQQHQPGP